MNTLDLLQPHLLSTDELRNLLKARQLVIPKLDDLSRTELLNIFIGYAVPLHQRLSKSTSTAKSPVDSATLIPAKRNHHERIEFGETDAMFRRISIHNTVVSSQQNLTRNSIAAVTNGCKKIKLLSNEAPVQCGGITNANGNHKLKRPTNAMETEIDEDSGASKRKKITWP